MPTLFFFRPAGIVRKKYLQVLRTNIQNIRFFNITKRIRQTACILLGVMIWHQLSSQTVAPHEYKVKAGFLYNFTQFVEWPDTAFKAPEAPFIVGILGTDPFGTYIDSILAGGKVLGHALVVQRYHTLKEIENCQILFINLSHADTANFADIQKQPILTVSDAEDFMKSGGIIRFFTENNKTRLQINPSAAKLAKLNISSKLLQLADIYSDTK